jgi:hypothetical protein
MSRRMAPRGGSRLRTAVAAGALVAMSALSTPAPAFAVPPPPAAPDCGSYPSNPQCQYDDLPASSDDSRCVDYPMSGACLYSPWNEQDP